MTRPRQPRRRVLLLAPYCDGTDVGEAWSSFQWVRRLAALHDVTVLTLEQRGLSVPLSVQLPGVRVVAWRDLPFVGRFERFNSMLKPGYAAFYTRARRWLRRALRSGPTFDVVHQLAPLALRYPCPAIGLGCPVVLGPLAGSLSDPSGHGPGLQPWYTQLRAADAWRLRNDPSLRRSFAGASVVIGVAPYVEEVLAPIPLRRFELQSETGIDKLPPQRRVRRRTAQQLRLLYVGRIVRHKGLRAALEALRVLAGSPEITLDIVGDGPDRGACAALAAQLELASRVTFHGRVERTRVDGFYRDADAFLFPSVREPSGNVVLEAQSHGLPVIVADRGGPGWTVDESSGLRVPVQPAAVYPSALAHAVRQLADDPDLAARLGRGARARVQATALWDTKVAWMSRLYESVLSQAVAA